LPAVPLQHPPGPGQRPGIGRRRGPRPRPAGRPPGRERPGLDDDLRYEGESRRIDFPDGPGHIPVQRGQCHGDLPRQMAAHRGPGVRRQPIRPPRERPRPPRARPRRDAGKPGRRLQDQDRLQPGRRHSEGRAGPRRLVVDPGIPGPGRHLPGVVHLQSPGLHLRSPIRDFDPCKANGFEQEREGAGAEYVADGASNSMRYRISSLMIFVAACGLGFMLWRSEAGRFLIRSLLVLMIPLVIPFLPLIFFVCRRWFDRPILTFTLAGLVLGGLGLMLWYSEDPWWSLVGDILGGSLVVAGPI